MTADRIVLALRGRDRDEWAQVLEAARDLGFRRFAAAHPAPNPGEEWFLEREGELRSAPPSSVGPRTLVTVRGPADLESLVPRLRQGLPAAVRFEGEWILPLEQLVATVADRDQLWFVTDRAAQVPSSLGALERGAGSVLVEVESAGEVRRLHALLEPAPIELDWQTAKVTRIEPGGLGDRIIVDTTSLLEPEEGLLVGSTAELLFHVRSEALGSRYTRPRPFRVNAGAAHSYSILLNGETRYLSELRAGDSVPVARAGSNGRGVRVGRLKIERRPLVMVEARAGATVGTLFVQEAETVRVSMADRAVPVTELSVGDELACVRLPPARHLGQVVHEQLEER